MSSSYILSDTDLDDAFSSPMMRAASNPDCNVLKAILQHGASFSLEKRRDLGLSWQPFWDSDSLSLRYDSPLLQAIRADLPKNVDLLLQAGADPSGLTTDMLSRYAAQFLRFKRHQSHITREEALDLILEPQKDQWEPLTPREHSHRRTTRQRFWTSEAFSPANAISNHARTALETAAAVGSIDIFDQLLAAGADHSWWMSDPHPDTIPSAPLPSFLSTSSPLHSAIEAGNNDMVMYILDKGFKPNTLALSTPTSSIPPIVATIVSSGIPNFQAFNLLLAHPRTNRDLRTKVFDMHILHFATALLLPSLLKDISLYIPLSHATASALGHTLLHVACLPLDDTYIQIFSEKVHQSVHNVRTLSRSWTPLVLHPHEEAGRHGLVRNYRGICDLSELPSAYFTAQVAVVRLLLQDSSQRVGERDSDGNSALHYLACHRVVNEELLQILRRVDGGEECWAHQENAWGWTPSDLYEDGKKAVAEPYKPFWT